MRAIALDGDFSASRCQKLALAKPKPREKKKPKPLRARRRPRTTWVARASRRRQRAEVPVKAAVRAAVVARDGHCRALGYGGCSGPSEWHHLLKRSATRGLPPEQRHTTRESLMLCRTHHQLAERGRLRIEKSDWTRGCDGALRMVLQRP